MEFKAPLLLATLVLLHCGWANASPDQDRRDCLTSSSERIYFPDSQGFDEAVAHANDITLSGPSNPALALNRALIDADVEYVHIQTSSTACGSPLSDRATAAAKCSFVGCQTNFPGNNAPVGSTMTIESCSGGLKTVTDYLRVGTSGSGSTWEVTGISQTNVGICPKLNRPGTGL
ncbi:hypothetical protein OS176_05675 [Xanthomonadaceae bacterium XH05]|nr:hypothetical protein [Xanthomonadaceae bacterium XH05]